MFRKRRGGAAFGIVLLVIAFPLLWWNEGWAVRDYTSIRTLDRLAVPGRADDRSPALDGQVVVMTGAQATAPQGVADPLLGVQVQGLRLRRTVEMFQWDEQGGTRDDPSVSYRQIWSDRPQDSSAFEQPEGHRNPPFPFESARFEAPLVRYGAFTLSSALVARLGNFAPVDPGATNPDLGRPVTASGPWLHIGGPPDSPQIGDLRIRFEAVPEQPLSLIAQQAGTILDEHVTRRGTAYAIVRPGVQGQAALVAAANSDVRARTRALRVAGFLLMLFGLRMVATPLVRIFGWIPALGLVLRSGVWIFAGVLAVALSLSVIAIAWLAYRPLLSLGLIVAAVVVLEVTVLRARRREKAAQDGP